VLYETGWTVFSDLFLGYPTYFSATGKRHPRLEWEGAGKKKGKKAS